MNIIVYIYINFFIIIIYKLILGHGPCKKTRPIWIFVSAAFFRWAGQLVAAMLDSVGLAPPGGVGVGKDVSRLAWCDPPRFEWCQYIIQYIYKTHQDTNMLICRLSCDYFVLLYSSLYFNVLVIHWYMIIYSRSCPLEASLSTRVWIWFAGRYAELKPSAVLWAWKRW